MIFSYKNSILTLIVSLLSCGSVLSQNKQTFTIILDAGHGGKDPGNSYHGFVEKEIALNTVLKVCEILEKEKDFTIIYTRKSDVFIELVKRPKIANKANANLFISIHCNSVKNFGPSGTETFVMGLSRSDMNLEVAKNENSVILLENNYKETYEGFNPKNPESLLGLTLKQEDNLNSSINLATKIQNNFTRNLDRNSRGVKQQPLWVLDAAYMPSVLIELGFLSNIEEGRFLNSDEGQNKMALQIANAIIAYKKEYFGQETNSISKTKSKDDIVVTNQVDQKPTIIIFPDDTIYKVQLFASSKKLQANGAEFKGLRNVSSTFNNNLYKYTYGETANFEEVCEMQKEAKKTGFKDAYIVAVKDGKSSKVTDVAKH